MAMISSLPMPNQDFGTAVEVLLNPVPKVERPRAVRISASKCASAAVVSGEGEALSREMDVAEDGMGGGRWVARNI